MLVQRACIRAAHAKSRPQATVRDGVAPAGGLAGVRLQGGQAAGHQRGCAAPGMLHAAGTSLLAPTCLVGNLADGVTRPGCQGGAAGSTGVLERQTI